MQHLAIKMSSSGAFWDAKDDLEESKSVRSQGAFWEAKDDLEDSKSVRSQILGALGCQSGVFGGPYGALGLEKGAPGYHFGGQKLSKISEKSCPKT